jgi:probable addiction module antidote protein
MRKKPYRYHEEATIESFQNDPRFATEYLNAVLEDGDKQELMTALRYLAKAFGGVSRLAEQAELNATTLYRTLSPQGNPELKSLTALLKAMGMRLAVQLAPPRRSPSRDLGRPRDAGASGTVASSGRARPRSTKRR